SPTPASRATSRIVGRGKRRCSWRRLALARSGSTETQEAHPHPIARWPTVPPARSLAPFLLALEAVPPVRSFGGGQEMATTMAGARADSPASQAYQILHLGFTVAPILFGLDKFVHLMV